MKMNFTTEDRDDDLLGDIIEVSLVLSWEEWMFMVDACHVFNAVLDASWDPPSLSKEDRHRMIKRFEDMDGDGEDSAPIDATAYPIGYVRPDDVLGQKMIEVWNRHAESVAANDEDPAGTETSP